MTLIKNKNKIIASVLLSFFLGVNTVFAGTIPSSPLSNTFYTATCAGTETQLYIVDLQNGDVLIEGGVEVLDDSPPPTIPCGNDYYFPTVGDFRLEYLDATYFSPLGFTFVSVSAGPATPPVPEPPAPTGSGFSLMIQDSENAYEEVIGENMQASVQYAGDEFYKPFMGAGLALLYNLRYWIVALVIIGAVVYFAYRAYRFYYIKH